MGRPTSGRTPRQKIIQEPPPPGGCSNNRGLSESGEDLRVFELQVQNKLTKHHCDKWEPVGLHELIIMIGI